jgi:hypothetical protein
MVNKQCKLSIDNTKVKYIMELSPMQIEGGNTMTNAMLRAEKLVATLDFNACIAYLENTSETSLDQLIFDRMEELDKERFIEFSKTF